MNIRIRMNAFCIELNNSRQLNRQFKMMPMVIWFIAPAKRYITDVRENFVKILNTNDFIIGKIIHLLTCLLRIKKDWMPESYILFWRNCPTNELFCRWKLAIFGLRVWIWIYVTIIYIHIQIALDQYNRFDQIYKYCMNNFSRILFHLFQFPSFFIKICSKLFRLCILPFV